MAEVETKRDGGVLTITLNRPEVLNAFTAEMHRQLVRRVQGGARARGARGRPHRRGTRLLRRAGPATSSRRPRRTSPAACAAITTRRPRGAAAREARHRRGQRPRRRSRPFACLRLRLPHRRRRRDLRPGLRQHRPRPGHGRHLPRPPAPRDRAGLRVHGHGAAPDRGRGARVGPRERGRRSRSPDRESRRASGRARRPADPWSGAHEAALRPRRDARRSRSSSSWRRSFRPPRRRRRTSRKASPRSSRSANRVSKGASRRQTPNREAPPQAGDEGRPGPGSRVAVHRERPGGRGRDQHPRRVALQPRRGSRGDS